MKALILLAICLTIFSQGLFAGSSRLEKKVQAATFAVILQDTEGSKHFACTATAFQKTKTGYLLLTAGHCVTGEYANLPVFVEKEVDSKLDLLPVTVVKAQHDELDFAVLELQTKDKLPIVKLDKTPDISIGSKVINVNFTEGIGKITSPGRISSAVSDVSSFDKDCDQCLNHFMVQLFAGPGASGSAIVSQRSGKIIGILTGGSGDTIGGFIEPIKAIEAKL